MSGRRGAALAGLVLVLLGTGCGDDPAPRADRLAASGAWSRPTPPGAERGVVYLEVRTDRPDAVVAASVPAGVAASATLHETMTAGEEGHEHHGGADGEMTMEPVDALAVTPEASLVFEPGGNHVMLDGLVAPLEAGQRFDLTLALRSGRTLEVPVSVGEPAG